MKILNITIQIDDRENEEEILIPESHFKSYEDAIDFLEAVRERDGDSNEVKE